MTRTAVLLATLLALLGLPAAAAAVPIQYDFVAGNASVEVAIDGDVEEVVSTPLSGSFVSFDAMAPAVTDLEYLIEEEIDLGSAFGTLELALTVVDGAGFSAPATQVAPGSFTYTGGPLLLSAEVTVSGGSLGFWGNGGNPVEATIDPVDGTVDVVGSTAFVNTETELSFDFVPFSEENGEVVVTASVDFEGVPEPGPAVLLLLAGAGLGVRAARRRHGTH